MSTGIEWTDETWNPVTGCSKVSPGCNNCYAIRMGARLQHLDAYAETVADGDWTGKINLVHDRLEQPLRWAKPRRVFVNSMSDLFHPDVPNDFIADVWDVMIAARQHQFQILTKRPQRMQQLLSIWDTGGDTFINDDGLLDAIAAPFDAGTEFYPPPNVWLGTSIESDRYTFRADHLRNTPAAIRFLSLEPLLGPLPSLNLDGIDWVIVGGESGPNARPMHPAWVRDIRDRCVAAGVAFFFKQWGEWSPVRPDGYHRASKNRMSHRMFAWAPDGSPYNGYQPAPGHFPSVCVWRVGKRNSGRVLGGRTWDEYPEVVS